MQLRLNNTNMKTPEEIYLDEVHQVHMTLGEKAAKLFMAEAVRKFVLNCLLKMEQLHKPSVIGSLPLVLDQLDSGEWVVKCNGQIVNNAGMFEDGKKEALYWIYMNATCYKRQ